MIAEAPDRVTPHMANQLGITTEETYQGEDKTGELPILTIQRDDNTLMPIQEESQEEQTSKDMIEEVKLPKREKKKRKRSRRSASLGACVEFNGSFLPEGSTYAHDNTEDNGIVVRRSLSVTDSSTLPPIRNRRASVLPSHQEEEGVQQTAKKLQTSKENGRASTQLSQPELQLNSAEMPVSIDSSREEEKEEAKWKPERSASKASVTSTSKWTTMRHVLKASRVSKRSSVDSFMQRFSTNRTAAADASLDEEAAEIQNVEVKSRKLCRLCVKLKSTIVHLDDQFMFFWLLIVSLATEYNLWVQILREGFPKVQADCSTVWYVMDSLADMIYLADVAVQFRTGYLKHGIFMTSSESIARHYIKSKYFWVDMATLLPLDFFYFAVGVHPMLRSLKFLKAYRIAQFIRMAETRSSSPNVLRVINLTHILLLLCHWFSAFYFMISANQPGTDNNIFTHPMISTSTQYLQSFYWAILTLTTIGDLPAPESNAQYVFQIVSYLIGVFVFATIVGQVGNAINNHNASRQDYERLLDGAKLFMRRYDVPLPMQRRVQKWYDYSWTRGRIHGAGDISSLAMLPDRLKTEIAIHVNLDILRKVSIFEDCEPQFLHDIVLKMRSTMFTPGDLVVKKGEIAREMFIIADGRLEVLSGEAEIIATLESGNFFGEIGILNLDGGVNKRTADVRSVGFTELFILERDVIVKAIKYYPSAKNTLMKHAKMRWEQMKQSCEHQKSVQSDSRSVGTIKRGSSLPSSPVVMLQPNNLSVPKLQRSPSLSRVSVTGSNQSLKSLDPDETMRIQENELIANMKKELVEKDGTIDRLSAELTYAVEEISRLQMKLGNR